jgi:hypothetical protein
MKHIRTSIDIDETLHKEMKIKAIELNMTLKKLILEGIKLIMKETEPIEK